MPIEIIKKPYEVLLRASENGIEGHIKLWVTTTDGQTIVNQGEEFVKSFEEAALEGFDIPAVKQYFDTVLIDTNVSLSQQIAELNSENQQLSVQVVEGNAQHATEIQQKDGQLLQLQQELLDKQAELERVSLVLSNIQGEEASDD